MTTKAIVTAATISLLRSAAIAQDVGDVSVGLGLTSFGPKLEGTYQATPDIRARGAIMGGLSSDFEVDETDVSGDGSIDLGGIAVLADYYPMQSGWRISGGLFFSNNEFEADGTAAGQSANISLEFANQLAPMITTGYDLPFGSGWTFTSEAGVIFTGGLDLSVTATGGGNQNTIDNDADVQDAISTAEDVIALPFLALGVSYSY